MKKISIIIVHWNTPDALIKQLDNLGSNKDIEIIVVDNNSSKKIDSIKSRFPQVVFIENSINHGYAFACNQGATKGEGDWLLFLNPDVSITESHAHELISKAEEQNLDAVSPDINQDGYQKPLASFWSLMIEFSPLGKFIPNNSSRKTLFGGCLLIKKSVLEQIGGWDERFFLWFEDSDLTRRLYDSDFKVGWVESDIQHVGALSFQKLDTKTKRQIFFLSMHSYADKYFNAFQKKFLKMITHRYSSNTLLPVLDNSIVLVVPNLQKKLLDDFLDHNHKFVGPSIELIIVTSALQKSEFYRYKSEYPATRFILLDYNNGFAKTVNMGLRLSRGEWLGTVNDDTIWDNDWVTDCLKQNDPTTGSINPIIYSLDGNIESSGINVLPYGKAIPITDRLAKAITPVDATNGAAVLYRHVALERTGLYDERFGSYLEDIDLSLRIQRNGYKNVVANCAKITHLKHQTLITKPSFYKSWNDFKNWILIIIKNWGMHKSLKYFPLILIERLRNLNGVLKSLLSLS